MLKAKLLLFLGFLFFLLVTLTDITLATEYDASLNKNIEKKIAKTYVDYFYHASKKCEPLFKTAEFASQPFYCLASTLENAYPQGYGEFVSGEIPHGFDIFYPGNTSIDLALLPTMILPIKMLAKDLENVVIDEKIYNNFVYGPDQEKSKDLKTSQEVLALIDQYQEKYFKLAKRNHTLIELYSGNEEAEKDWQNILALYDEIENKITKKHKNNPFFQRYLGINDMFNNIEEDLTEEQIGEMQYEAIDKLLNDVYKEIKAKLPQNDFIQLRNSQRAWLKEVLDYHVFFEKQDFGSIRARMNYQYENDMRTFRTLLLMLYFEVI